MIEPAALKPVLSALALPPAPFVILALVGARIATGRRRGLGFLLVIVACTGLWLGSCIGTAQWLQDSVLRPPPALDDTQRQRLAQIGGQRQGAGKPPVAIWVLGAGRHRHADEYDGPNLTLQAMARLRYGLWLARQTGLPLGFTGGVGWAQDDTVSEAATAARIARQEGGVALQWQESMSRDTRENATLSMPLLKAAGVQELVLVTHAAHMPRAQRAFTEAAAAAGMPLRITPAPIAFVTADDDRALLRWLPSPHGYTAVYNALHELLGWWTGR